MLGAWLAFPGESAVRIPLTPLSAVAGEDRKFVPAEARIEGKTVIVTSDTVDKIAAVRYGWARQSRVQPA